MSLNPICIFFSCSACESLQNLSLILINPQEHKTIRREERQTRMIFNRDIGRILNEVPNLTLHKLQTVVFFYKHPSSLRYGLVDNYAIFIKRHLTLETGSQLKCVWSNLFGDKHNDHLDGFDVSLR